MSMRLYSMSLCEYLTDMYLYSMSLCEHLTRMRLYLILGFTLLLLVFLVSLIGCSDWHDGIELPCEYGEKIPFPESIDLPEVRSALKAQKKTEDCRIRFVSMSSAMEKSVSEAMGSLPSDITHGFDSSSAKTVKELAEATAGLKAIVHHILDHKDEYIEAIEQYEEAAREATNELRRAAKLFRGFSEKETYKDFQEDYQAMADLLDSLAEHYQTQLASFHVSLSKADFKEITAYLECGGRMLDRFEAALAIATPLSELTESNQYLKKLHEFIQQFESFRVRIRQANKKLKESKTPSSSTAKNSLDRKNTNSFFQITTIEFALRELSS